MRFSPISRNHAIGARRAWAFTALAAACALAACGRHEDASTASGPAYEVVSYGTAGTSGTGSAAPGDSSTAAATAGNAQLPPTATGSTTIRTPAGTTVTAALPPAEQLFLTKAAEDGLFEVEVCRLATEKASDAAVRSYAQMLVDDHGNANDKLRQIATSHGLALPAMLPDDQRQEIDRLAKLAGREFDRQFVAMVGIRDTHHGIDAFRRAGRNATSDDVKTFAQSTLPTLQQHLAAAERLPVAKG